ncbi:MAG: acyltransferase family protein [Pseudomonadota bacterium]
MHHRIDIQIIRGIAVILVVLFHLEIPGFSNGYLGVDIFFVLSGFLMAMLYDRGTKSDFLLRRLDRLLPAFAVTIMTSCIVGSLFLLPFEFNALKEQSLASAFFIPNVHFWLQNSYFDKTAFKPLLNLWSLGVEFQFYLLVPFIYPLLRRSKLLLAITIGVTFITCLIIQTKSAQTAFYWMPLRIWEFLIGAWVAWHPLSLSGSKKSIAAYVASVALMILIWLVPVAPSSQHLVMGHPGLIALLTCCLTALVLHTRLPTSFENSWPGLLLERLGDYSYSIYLVHFPIIIFVNYRIYEGTRMGFDGIQQLLAILLLTAIAAYLSYNLVERKSANNFRRPLVRFGLVPAMLFAAVISGTLNENRVDGAYKQTLYAWKDTDSFRCGGIPFRLMNPNADICALNKEGGQIRVLLIGDSHANSIKQAFANVASEHQATTYFYHDNLMLLTPELGAHKILEDIELFKIDAIVLHFSNRYDDKNFVRSMRELLNGASKIGVSSKLIAPIPYYQTHVPKAIYKNQVDDGAKLLEKKLLVHREQTIDFGHFAVSLDTNLPSTYDPAVAICPDGNICEYMDKRSKTPYYYDNGHLTLTGAELLIPTFHQIISAI